MKKMTTKIMAATLALVMAAAMTACGNNNNGNSSSVPPSSPATSTPSTSQSVSESTSSDVAGEYDTTATRFYEAITGARDEESNKYNNIYTHDPKYNVKNFGETYADLKNENGSAYTEEQLMEQNTKEQELLFSMLGFTPADVEHYAMSISPMNIQAYGVAVIKPAAGKEEIVKTGLENFIANQQKSFENYLVDQYDIAKAARLERLDDGTYVLVMGEGQNEIFESISKGLTTTTTK